MMADYSYKITVDFVIPEQTRTIFFNRIGRYKLCLPKFKVEKREFNDKNYGKYWAICALNAENELCYVPFPNIGLGNCICFGDLDEQIITKEDFIEALFNTIFDFGGSQATIMPYIDNEVEKAILNGTPVSEVWRNFYKNWGKTGHIELIEIE